MYICMCKYFSIIGILFTCSTLLVFPYTVPADIHRSIQHVSLCNVPVDMLPRLFLWFSQVNHFQCRGIYLAVQCACMYSVAGA